MITDNTIENVLNQADIVEVIGKVVKLKKAGSSWKGMSPFSEERTPSFMVSPSKRIFKDFSSGKGGNVVSFVMEHHKVNFPEAIEMLAKDYNIPLELDGDYNKEEYQKQQTEKISNTKLMQFAAEFYQKTLGSDTNNPAHEEVYNNRLLSKEEVIQWQIGYCPNGALLRSVLVEKAKTEQGKDLFLIGDKWDIFQNRVIYPLHDANGLVVGLAGRSLNTDHKKYAKWINPANGPLYNKDRVLYGLHYAKNKIQKTGKVYLVEGYNDVIAMHRFGLENTIAPCGTNISENQIKIIKRFCQHVVLVFDNDEPLEYLAGKEYKVGDKVFVLSGSLVFYYKLDEIRKETLSPDSNESGWIKTNYSNPGLKGAFKSIDMFLKNGFQVELANLPNGEDPDSFTRSAFMIQALEIGFDNFMEDLGVDALYFKAQHLMEQAVGEHELSAGVKSIANSLAHVQDDFLRDTYVKGISKAHKPITASIMGRMVKEAKEQISKAIDRHRPGISKEEQNAWSKIPRDVDREDVLKHGFYHIKKFKDERTGYWFRTSASGDFTQVSNFVMTPLFHKYDQDDNTRIIKIENEFTTEIVEMPSKALISVDQFRNFLFEKGPFFFEGEKHHLNKLNKKYLYEFPKAYELKTLGFQSEGFFAFYNAAYNGKLTPYTDDGLFEHNEKNYFSPASSDIYKDYRKDDDMYENDRYLEYTPEIISFGNWGKLMEEVYGDHAKACVPFALVALFRDIVFKVDNNCPHLYFYGQAKSGKSKAAESVDALFFKGKPAFNLNSGTDFAFAASYSRFRNCPAVFNEFDDSDLKPEWFQALKGAYDGEGRERGKGGSKKKTETMKVHSAIVLLGQYLSTKDDNSILSRCIMRAFRLVPNRSQSQINAYNNLKEKEKQGLSGTLIKLLEQREFIEKNYYNAFNQKFKQLGSTLKKQGKKTEERVLRNYSSMCTLYSMIEGRVANLPWKSIDYDQWAMNEITNLSSLITSSDILITFWNIVELLFVEGKVQKGIHFKVTHNVKSIRHTVNGKDVYLTFDKPKSILHMRLRLVQLLYAKESKESTLNEQSLKTYLKNKDYYLGSINSEKFDLTSSSAYIFDYKGLDISLVNDLQTAQEKAINNQVEELPLPKK